ncbi:MAG: hypothetical protein HZA17_09265 [Nitrospirae bacterium]|nr:hypothetical protein [Nitrospirota bacterium]
MKDLDQNETEKTAKCPHSLKLIVSFCRVEEKIHVPTSLEVTEYCESREHTKCPLYIKKKSGGKEIREEWNEGRG